MMKMMMMMMVQKSATARNEKKKKKKARLLTLPLKNVPLLRVEQRFQVFRGRFRHDVCILLMLFFVLFFCYFCVVVVLFFAFEGVRSYALISAHLLLKFGFVSASFLLVGLYFAYSGTSEWLLLS